LQCDSGGHGIPSGHHSFACFGSFLAHRTSRIVRGELSKTIPVDGVPARHLVRRSTRREQEFLTDRTIGSVLAGIAIVIVVQFDVDAHAAGCAVAEVFTTAHATKPAFRAMIRTFGIVHP
jgi:hypothetical protein